MTPDGEEPTEDEKRSLRHIAENLPVSAWLVAIVELCERFTYYGMSGLFQNYVLRPLDGTGGGPGALGMGHQGATGLTTFFQFWCYGTFDIKEPEVNGMSDADLLLIQLLPSLVPLSLISTSASTRLLSCSVVSISLVS